LRLHDLVARAFHIGRFYDRDLRLREVARLVCWRLNGKAMCRSKRKLLRLRHGAKQAQCYGLLKRDPNIEQVLGAGCRRQA
jgi:hypothetical protein